MPDIKRREESIVKKKDSLNALMDKRNLQLEELKKQIAYARGLANRIEVGGEFSRDSSLQLRNPENLEDLGASFKMSMHLKTRNPHGFVAYIGNPVKVPTTDKSMRNKRFLVVDARSISPNTDFMALETRNGKLVLTVDLGSGPQSLINEKYIATGEWFQVIIEKVGKVITCKVVDSNSTITTAQGLWTDPATVFNLDSERSVIYVGGIPKGAQLQEDVHESEFTGNIEDIKIGDIPMSLWNAVHINNVKGANPRDKPTKESNGARFDGSSFVMLQRGKQNIALDTFINLRFKTYAEDGLLYFIGGDDTYLSLQMKRGAISLVFSGAEKPGVITSSKQFNDGNWHLVESSRSESDEEMLLLVDKVEIGFVKNFGKGVELQSNNVIFVGGLPKTHKFADTVESNFIGCIKDFQIGPQMQSLKDGQASPGVSNGCPDTSLREASFNASQNSYILLNSSINERAEITLKFKTVDLDGLLFFTSNDDHSSYLSVFLKNGAVMMKTNFGEIGTSETKAFNDNRWHYVSAKREQTNLQIHVDEDNSVNTAIDSSSTTNAATKTTFLGSVPSGHTFDFSEMKIPTTFTGCIGDVTVNDKFENFAESLPLVPNRDTEASVEDGVRFGSTPFSRYEFMVPVSVTSELLNESNFKIAFKTDGPVSDGVLFFVVGAGNIDFVGLFMQAGKIIFSFNCGSGASLIVTDNMYNDSAWHTVVFNIRGRNGILRVLSENSTEQKYGHSVGDTNSLNVKAPIYIGGLSEEARTIAKNKLKGITQSFSGCIKDVHIQAKKYAFSGENIGYDAPPCSEKVESGAFFSGKGYLSVYDDFRVGERIAFSFEVKPRNLTGVIMAVFGKVDFMILEMVENALILTVNNGAGSFSSELKFQDKHLLCNGEWHLIEGYKQSNMVTVNVDDLFAEPGWGVGGVYSTDTNGPLYIGGVPESATLSELTGKPHFVGCIRNFQLNKKPQTLIDARVEGNVNVNTCSTI
ncbi:Laminin subunit alpha-like protein [Leptotrombidium deliense]|uniref:Laminin subunit alpha-like protein n=1 Tax=Leptotrombidium deliense TaxID=299467 RepID=A0A443SIV0_9ACAR|nr:Laminin subunit alpha-like protein [Leptotrombidium deliense]